MYKAAASAVQLANCILFHALLLFSAMRTQTKT